MRNNVLNLLVGFVVMCGLVLLFKVGLDKMTAAEAAPADAYARLDVDLDRRAILYRVRTGDTLWSLADRFYGNGHRWTDISRANTLSPGQGLQTGAVIKIPLAPGEPEPQPVIVAAPEPAAQSPAADAVEAVAQPANDSIESTALKLASAKFPKGAVCVARTTERQTVTLNIYDATAGDDATAVAVFESRRGSLLRELRAEDYDGDGVQEIYTIWQPKVGGPLSRILRVVGTRVEVVCETPDDPVALARLRAREGN